MSRFSNWIKTKKGKITTISVISIAGISFIITPIIVFNVTNVNYNNSFVLSTIGSTSVEGILNELIKNEQGTGFAQQLESIGVYVEHKPAHNGSSDAFSKDPKYEQSYIGFQSREVETNELESWGYSASSPMYANWETDALAFIINDNNNSNLSFNLTQDATTNNLKQIYKSNDSITITDSSSNQYTFSKAFNRDDSSGTFEAFEKFIEWDSEIDKWGTIVSEVKNDQSMIGAVNDTHNSIGYASLISVTDGQGTVLPQYSNLTLASVNGIIPTIDTVKNGTYQASRPFNVFFRVEASESEKWINAMFNPLTGEWGDLTPLISENVNKVGSFLFFNWIQFSENALEIVDIGSSNDTSNWNLMDLSDIEFYINTTEMF